MAQPDTSPEQGTLPTGVSLPQAYPRDVWLLLAKANQIKNLKTGSVRKGAFSSNFNYGKFQIDTKVTTVAPCLPYTLPQGAPMGDILLYLFNPCLKMKISIWISILSPLRFIVVIHTEHKI